MTTFSPIQAVNLREHVVAQVRSAIIEGVLRPGDHVVEKSLTDQLGVSRTPVREALILLESEGLVVSTPHRGSFVRVFTEDDVSNVFTMRTTLENFAAERIIHTLEDADFTAFDALIAQQRACISADDDRGIRRSDVAFHRTLVHRAAHTLLTHSWEQIVAQIAALLYLRREAIPTYNETLAISDHEAIVAALRAHDLDALKAHNARINTRVADECRFAVRAIPPSQRATRRPPPPAHSSPFAGRS